MINALQKLLHSHRGQDVMAFRRGPFALYLWNDAMSDHTRYDISFKPPAPRRPMRLHGIEPSHKILKHYKQAVKDRCTFLNRQIQAKRVSF